MRQEVTITTNFGTYNMTGHVRWVPCHHGMARPQVADVRWVPCHHGMARPQVADVRWVPCHHGMARPQVADVRWVPCHHSMARPQVAVGKRRLPVLEGSCEYIELAVGESRQGVVLQLGGWAWG
jgi:hypothetical protein